MPNRMSRVAEATGNPEIEDTVDAAVFSCVLFISRLPLLLSSCSRARIENGDGAVARFSANSGFLPANDGKTGGRAAPLQRAEIPRRRGKMGPVGMTTRT